MKSIPQSPSRWNAGNLSGLLFVLVIHTVALYELWTCRLIPVPEEAMTLFVNFIVPPAPEKAEEPKNPPQPKPQSKLQPKPQPKEKPQLRQLVAETHVVSATDDVAPPPPPTPAPEPVIQAPQVSLPAAPVALGSELSVVCPERLAPAYPPESRRLGEIGQVVLRVELSETGHVVLAKVQGSSGYARLDEAALSAVRAWRCTPPTRNGQPVRATALQPFNFILQGS